MSAGSARVSWTSVTLSSAGVTSGLSALSLTRLAGRLSAASLARVAGRLASRLSTSSPARVASRLTLRLTCIASSARIARTSLALRAACIATCTEASVPAARTGETGLVDARSSSATFGCAGGPSLGPKARLRQQGSRSRTELNIKVKLVLRPRFMSACYGPSCGELCTLSNEALSATQAAEWRLVWRKLLGMDYVILLNLNTQTHIEVEIEEPVTRFRTAAQQADEAGEARRRLRNATHQALDDLIFLQRFLGTAAFLVVCHIFAPLNTALRNTGGSETLIRYL